MVGGKLVPPPYSVNAFTISRLCRPISPLALDHKGDIVSLPKYATVPAFIRLKSCFLSFLFSLWFFFYFLSESKTFIVSFIVIEFKVRIHISLLKSICSLADA